MGKSGAIGRRGSLNSIIENHYQEKIITGEGPSLTVHRSEGLGQHTQRDIELMPLRFFPNCSSMRIFVDLTHDLVCGSTLHSGHAGYDYLRLASTLNCSCIQGLRTSI